MSRHAQVIHVHPDKLPHYLHLHANPWPGVLNMIHECNIRNYSIYLLDDHTLFAYFEYIGTDFSADMQKMASDPETQRWWSETDPCQYPLEGREEGWWHDLVEVFHCGTI